MSFTPEDQLIIEASRVEVGDEARAVALRLLRMDLDWHYILETSVQHAVAPLFWHGLNKVCDGNVGACVPQNIAKELRALYSGNGVRNQRLYRVVGDIAREFSAHGIKMMGLKDLQLAQVVYPNLSLRPIGDIDLLIRKEQYPDVAACMASMGFAPAHGIDIPYTLKYAWAHHFRRTEDNVWVDMQWNVLQMEWDVCGEANFNFEIERMWRGARPLCINDYEILVPRPEDMLFHLCMHLEGHHYCELVLFCDIAELLRHYDGVLDWGYLISITQTYQVASSIYYALIMVRELFGAAVPDSVLCQITPTYFKANMFAPLYGNLGELHHAFDDLRSCAYAPPAAMAQFETTTRRQAAVARYLYRELDAFASEFTAADKLLILDGNPSEKIYPDNSLTSFEPVELFILERDLSVLPEVLKQRGFGPNEAEGVVKTASVESRDPLLSGRTVPLRMTVSTENDFAALIRVPASRYTSKADIARKVLRHNLFGPRETTPDVTVAFRVHALTPEQLFIVLAVRFDQRRRDRLFNLCSLLEFCRAYRDDLNWHIIEEISKANGVEDQIQRAFETLAQFSEKSRWRALPQSARGGDRMLESARYDEHTGRYGAFKVGFLLVLTLLSLRGTVSKCKYAARLIRREFRSGALLAALRTALMSIARRHPKSRNAARAFAYWIESPPMQALGQQSIPNVKEVSAPLE